MTQSELLKLCRELRDFIVLHDDEGLIQYSEMIERADALLSAHAAQEQEEPMNWPLPCDVTVGHGTIKKGCKLSTLVTRMQVLYDMVQKYAPPNTADQKIKQREALANLIDQSEKLGLYDMPAEQKGDHE